MAVAGSSASRSSPLVVWRHGQRARSLAGVRGRRRPGPRAGHAARRGDHRRAARGAGTSSPGAWACRSAAADRGRGLLPRRSSSTPCCRAACSATCTGGRGTVARRRHRRVRCAPWRGSGSAGQVVQAVAGRRRAAGAALARAAACPRPRGARCWSCWLARAGRGRWCALSARPRTVPWATWRGGRRRCSRRWSRWLGHVATFLVAARAVGRRPLRPAAAAGAARRWSPMASRSTSPGGDPAKAWPPGRSRRPGSGRGQGVATAVVYGVLVVRRRLPGAAVLLGAGSRRRTPYPARCQRSPGGGRRG